ncbi:hypothetical protein D3C84_896700 [compost metagenome]
MTDIQLVAYLKDPQGRSFADPDAAPDQLLVVSADVQQEALDTLSAAGFVVQVTGNATLLLTAPKEHFERVFNASLEYHDQDCRWSSPPTVPSAWCTWLATVLPAPRPQYFS